MKPLVVLIVSFFLSLSCSKLFTGDWNFLFSGNFAMSIMLLFTALGHFKFPKGMAMMIPSFIPAKTTLVYGTGIIEVAAAIGLMIPSIRLITAILLIIFFIVILPANINAAIRKVDYQKGNTEGPGLTYLYFRVPLQLLLIAWVWYFGIWL